MQSRPFIIHVSGAPGTGKTTLGENLKARFGSDILVKDSDEFIQRDTEGGKYLMSIEAASTMEEYNRQWKRIITDLVDEFLKANAKECVIVVCGLLDNFGGENAEHYLDKADLKLFMTIDMDVLLKQYYERVCASGQADKDYWKYMARDEVRVYSSHRIIVDYERLTKNHVANGYTLMNRDEVFTYLTHIIQKHIE